MKRIASLLLCALIVITTLASCGTQDEYEDVAQYKNTRFEIAAEYGGGQRVYVDKETGVLYIYLSVSGYKGWGSVLLGPDGLPLLADGYQR